MLFLLDVFSWSFFAGGADGAALSSCARKPASQGGRPGSLRGSRFVPPDESGLVGRQRQDRKRAKKTMNNTTTNTPTCRRGNALVMDAERQICNAPGSEAAGAKREGYPIPSASGGRIIKVRMSRTSERTNRGAAKIGNPPWRAGFLSVRFHPIVSVRLNGGRSRTALHLPTLPESQKTKTWIAAR